MTEFLSAPRPIRSVLIANRGEIACRIVATCRRLGLRSIAVFSAADAGARHVRLADEAYPIGPAAPAESYLSIDRLIAAAKASGCDAVHPGYGFLSENADFVAAVEAAGLIFVGPTADTVRRMGSKIEARRIATAAGVPVVPGFDGTGDEAPATAIGAGIKADGKEGDDITGDDRIGGAADRIGYPVLVKASAGGGGRGMRRAATPADLPAALASARREAAAAFGDATVFVEKLILAPRHIEVQIFGDGRGGVVHFHDRDCSVQRNHQKVIEEAPAPRLSSAVRQALFDHATRLAAQIAYAGAGTVEFVMGADDATPYFLEMNTRLQVEHPVTEAICGVDLVAWQLRQAAGLPMPLTQDQIVPRGHAIEVRINAERPEAGFLPDTGRIDLFQPGPGLRVDTAVETGDTVSSHYDSMIAKLVARGPDRATALSRLVTGLDRTAIFGPGTNLGLLRDCLTATAFVEGRATTGFLEATFPGGWQPDPAALLRLRGHAALTAIGADRCATAGIASQTGDPRMAADAPTGSPLTRADGFRVGGANAPGRVPLEVTDAYGRIDITLTLGRAPTVSAEGTTLPLIPPDTADEDGRAPGQWPLSVPRSEPGAIVVPIGADDLGVPIETSRGAHLDPGNAPAPLSGTRPDGDWRVGTALRGLCVIATVRPLAEARMAARSDAAAEGTIAAPLSGLVSEVRVARGDRVAKGDVVAVMEAMKLVHALSAPFAGTVTQVAVDGGQTVARNEVLIEIEPSGG